MPRPTNQPMTVPGQVAEVDAPDAPDEVAALRLALAAREAELATLKATGPGVPVVVTPVTPHGAVKLMESAFRTMLTSEVAAKVAAGEITLGGKPSALCADGYFCDPSYR